MLRTTIAVLALALGSFAVTAAVEPPPEGVAYTIDSVHSTALFRVQHLGAGRFWGRFNDVSGSVLFDRGVEIQMNVSIRTDSIDSGHTDLDKHLMSPDFFNAKEPSCATMTFKSSGCSMGDKGIYMVSGDLTIHGVTKQITVPVEFTGAADMGRGARAGFETTFSIKRSEYGMNFGVEKGMLGDEVRITVALEGVEATTDSAGEKK
ncbi:MAG: YceI family protein [Phycisphaerae bacterium]|nr:YceI family protein [Phycisphaerae bacterium]